MLRKAIFLLALPIAFYTLSALPAFADCPAGTQPATAADIAKMQAAGIPNPVVGTCWNPSDANVGQSSAQAKQDLSTMVCGSNINIADLDAKFSVCADKFMQQLRQASPGACIRSAFRDPQQQLAACMNICGSSSCPGKCAAPGHSYHQKGLAIDVNYRISNSQAWQIAASDGIVNPGGLHSSDPNHFQAANTNCAGVSVPSGDQGDYYNDTNHFFPAQPSLPFDNSLRSALGMQPPPPPPPPAPVQTTPTATPAPATTATPATTAQTPPSLDTLNTTPYTPGTCSPQTYCSQQDGNIYYRTSSCVDQIYQQCSAGCTGVICNATSTLSGGSILGGLLDNSNDNQNTDDNSNGSGTSSFDLIDYFANGGGATGVDIGTGTPIDIGQNADIGDASILAPTSTGGVAIQTPPQGSQVNYGPAPQQTFTSSDLGTAPNYSGQSTFQLALANMRATLLVILGYLQPFGGAVSAQATFSE